MNSTRKRKIVTFEVDPRVTHKAAAVAVKQGCTTAEVIRGWIEKECGLVAGDPGIPGDGVRAKRGGEKKGAEGRGA